MILLSGEAVSYFGTTITASGGEGKDFWYEVGTTIPPHMAAERTWTVIATGLVVCSCGTWILLREDKTKGS
jgi:hypothetical protein